MVDPVYTTCEAGKRRLVSHTRADVRCGAMRTFCCWIGDHSILPQLLYAIPIASRVSRFVESESTTQQYKPARLLSYSLTSSCLWYSWLGDHYLLLQLLFAIPIAFSFSCIFSIPIASTARTVLAKAGLQNLFSLKVLHRIAVNQVFGERLDATACSLNDYSWRHERLLRLHPGNQNDYIVYFLVIVHGIALRTSSCIDIVRLHQARPVE